MLYANIDTIVKNYNFISVDSSSHPGTIFQGILGASPKNEIIKIALYKAYNTDPNILDNYYHYFCKQLYDIIKDNYEYNIKLYEERRINHDIGDEILDGNILLFKHYWKHKVIPIYFNLANKSYTWGKLYITFLDNFKINAFGKGNYRIDNFKMNAFVKGNYRIIDQQNIIANFGGRIHNICFNIDYTEFKSTRKDDLEIINGKIINNGKKINNIL